jgi:Protein of unknown function with PCYCGC motif
MKSKIGLMAIVGMLAVGSNACSDDRRQTASRKTPAPPQQAAAPQKAADDPHSHSHGDEVPSFETDAVALKKLAPTLSPALFNGKQREGYEVAQAIPRTLAQLPCYCHCDRGFGHKSLHTCFVDDHAAHCAICIDEALLAYRLETKDKLTPAQIRERIVAQYSSH